MDIEKLRKEAFEEVLQELREEYKGNLSILKKLETFEKKGFISE